MPFIGEWRALLSADARAPGAGLRRRPAARL